MEKIRKIVSINGFPSFFFAADNVIMVRKKDYLGWWNGNMKFNFNSKTKQLTIYYDYETIREYEITYYSKKDERKLKLEKLNASF